MSSIGVVVLRNSILGNAQVLQESVNNATNISNNAAERKPKREIIIVRKKQKIQSQPTVSVTSLLRAAVASSDTPVAAAPSPSPARAAKRPRVRDDASDDGRAPAPPLAVARRNARERNRVRQVNNGFAALRRHIPDEVAEAFESANSSRGPNKKPSKVETLRMAVEYIRNLEGLLNISAASDKENTTRTGAESFPSPASSSSPRDTSFERSYFSLNSPALDDDDDETDSLPPPITRHQYARLPADVFQLAAASHLYEEDEGGQPATPASDLIVQDELLSPHLLDSNFHFMNSAEHFTIIHPEQNFGSEADGFDEAASELDVKYAETLRLADVHADMLGEESALLSGLSTIDPQLVLPQEQYLLDEAPAGAEGEDSCDALELKRELAEAQVSAEDRQQFEETLKWWQEKTRSARPVLVSRDKVD